MASRTAHMLTDFTKFAFERGKSMSATAVAQQKKLG